MKGRLHRKEVAVPREKAAVLQEMVAVPQETAVVLQEIVAVLQKARLPQEKAVVLLERAVVLQEKALVLQANLHHLAKVEVMARLIQELVQDRVISTYLALSRTAFVNK